jgi:uncharacterized protein DUF4276
MDIPPAPVLVIASGSTEFEALPVLLRESLSEIGRQVEVRFPPKHQKLDARMAAQLIKAGYWSLYPRPQKAVVLVDCDARARNEVIDQIRTTLTPLVQDLMAGGLQLFVAAAKWHLEAWFFADPERLQQILGRDLGGVTPGNPDEISNPKQHLINLLRYGDRIYTARVAAEIARTLRPAIILAASPSFSAFDSEIRDGAH